jgi:RNA polymerase sigma-70 factor (ECF subfamily)
VARNRQRDVWKSPPHRRSLPLDAVAEAPVSPFDEIDPDAVPDRRLALLFVCAHPAIDAAGRTPLMLQTVLGFEAAADRPGVRGPRRRPWRSGSSGQAQDPGREIPSSCRRGSALPRTLPPVLEAIYGCHVLDASGPRR